jgi:uncharacterized membrane protein YoaK (UPF0700 family)
VISLFKDYKPLQFFSWLSLIFFILSLIFGIPVIAEFVAAHYISKVPSAILAVGLMLIAILFLMNGFILDTLVKNERKSYELGLVRYADAEDKRKR